MSRNSFFRRCCSSDTSVNTINHTVAESNFSRASNCATGLTISPTRRTDSSNTVISRENEAVHAAYRSMLCRNDVPSVKRSSNINHHGLVSVPGFRFSCPFHRLSSKPAKIDGYRWLSQLVRPRDAFALRNRREQSVTDELQPGRGS